MEKIIYNILQQENIILDSLKKSSSGFTNQVYFINDDMVIKLTDDHDTIKQLQKEVSIYQNMKLPYIPQYIASGSYENYYYLIISKLSGSPLYSIWHTLDDSTRIDIVKQIANILKTIHNIDADFVAEKDRDLDWISMWKTRLSDRSSALKDMGYDTTYVDKFISNHIPTIFAKNNYGLVYNDAHFDNFLYDGETVYLIDFDRMRYCPIDYELMIFKCMCDNPSKFASEIDEPNIVDSHYSMVYSTFKAAYPELYDIPYIHERLTVYLFNYLIRQALSIKNHSWIKELLDSFNTFVRNI